MADLTGEEFERQYAERSAMTVEQLREWRIVVRCDCDYEGCQGWAMVPTMLAREDAEREMLRDFARRA